MKFRTDKIHTFESVLPKLRERKNRGEKIVFTNGCFDLIHVGHVQYLEQARALGDLLVIAVNADETVRELKGPDRPVVPCNERMEVLAAFDFCDYVFPFYEPTPCAVLSEILPDMLVKGGDWGENQVVGREIIEEAGGKVIRIPPVKGASTTNIIERVLSQNS